MHVERLGVAEVVGSPHAVDELPARQHASGVAHQQLKQLELLERHVDLLAVDRDRVAVDVERHPSALEHVLFEVAVGRGRATQHGAHPREQLARRVRLRDVVVGAELEPHDDVDLAVLGGQHHDRHLARHAHLSAHLGAGNARQHQIEQHHVGALFAEHAQRLLSVVDDLDLEALALQQVGERIREVGFILNEQNASHAISSFRCALDLAARLSFFFLTAPGGGSTTGRS